MQQTPEPLENLIDQFARFPALAARARPAWRMK